MVVRMLAWVRGQYGGLGADVGVAIRRSGHSSLTTHRRYSACSVAATAAQVTTVLIATPVIPQVRPRTTMDRSPVAAAIELVMTKCCGFCTARRASDWPLVSAKQTGPSPKIGIRCAQAWYWSP